MEKKNDAAIKIRKRYWKKDKKIQSKPYFLWIMERGEKNNMDW